ncbi:MAG: response regulator transcription factor [Egibacteraceae bacterium]
MHLLVLSEVPGAGKSLLPALEFLDHTVAAARLAPESLDTQGSADVVVVDATADLAAASQVCRAAAAAERARPVLLVVADAGLAAVKSSWGFDDFLAPSAQPAELETRLRLLADRSHQDVGGRTESVGELTIDEDTYIVRLRGRPLDLTYREFELLRFLVARPRRVFTRGQLLQEVWGYDYYGGTRTVDVHIRRLRAKLGAEYEQLIGTVRGVGYKLDPQGAAGHSGEPDDDPDDEEPDAPGA